MDLGLVTLAADCDRGGYFFGRWLFLSIVNVFFLFYSQLLLLGCMRTRGSPIDLYSLLFLYCFSYAVLVSGL